ncbi:MAG: thioredoxin [Spirochaetota bacterium]
MNNNEVILKCRGCGIKNRVLFEKIALQPVCGRCGEKLFIPEAPIDISENEMNTEVLEETIPTAVDFWAPWCGPCRIMGPVLDEIAKEYRGRIKVVRVNSDENLDLSSRYKIQGIPTLILFRDGIEIDRLVGAASKKQVLKFLRL